LWMLAAAACATVVAPLALWRFADDTPAVQVAETPVYRTATRQRLMVTLSDGSRLTLDTDTRVRMAYTRTERRLVLERGQALFEVAKHQTRPFVVTAGAQAVTAHGTAFDVRLETSAVRVALLEGLVSVAGKGAPGKPVAWCRTTSSPHRPAACRFATCPATLSGWQAGAKAGSCSRTRH
ncbi:FecR domain-containing protein, partial [Sphingomonas sp. Ant20]|uniref:FecR family protein n=1 Tax=Sphingomonas sp. Ant20 TaxID=104605 RepID=UPI0018E3DD2A